MVHQLKKWLVFVSLPALAQSSNIAPTHSASEVSNSTPAILLIQTNQTASRAQRIEDTRLDCLQNRRTICGKILQVQPDGLVVESGYTNLMRAPLSRSWLVPASVNERPTPNLVEGNQPACVCVGLVFVNNLPKKPAPKVFDYVNLTGYPNGQYTYISVGDIRRTVRRFSAKLTKAVQWKLDEMNKENQIPVSNKEH